MGLFPQSLGMGLVVLSRRQEFTELMQSKGTKEGNPDVLEDAVALAGVSKFPARIKCALLGWMAFKDAAVRITTTNRGE